MTKTNPTAGSAGNFQRFRWALPVLAALAVLLWLLAPAPVQAADISNDDFTWEESTGSLTIHTNEGSTAWRNALPYVSTVTTLPDQFRRSYNRYSQVKSVTIDPGVTELGYIAFSGCDEIVNVTIPDSVTRVRERAFELCLKLESAILPDNVTEIESNTFFACFALRDLTLPKGLREIGSSAFIFCGSLSHVDLPAELEKMKDWAFAYCTSLNEITLPPTLQKIGPLVFAYSGIRTAKFQGMTAPTLQNIDVFFNSSLNEIIIPEGATGYGGGNWPGAPVSYTSVPLPQITAHPQDVRVDVGEDVTFSSAADNPAAAYALSYQWQLSRDGGLTWSAVPGETGETFSTGPVTYEMNGFQYRCQVSNLGAGYSDVAVLTVNAPPTPTTTTQTPTTTKEPAAPAAMSQGTGTDMSQTADGLSQAPQTGDGANGTLWVVLGVLALAVLAASAAVASRRKA